jgi:hypothetical protein
MNVKLFVIILICVAGIAGLYAGLTFLKVWVTEKGRPREEMFLCDKHGAMRKKHTITFQGASYCSVCFHQRMAASEEIKG